MLTEQELVAIVDNISIGTELYDTWCFKVSSVGDGFHLQLQYLEPDVATGKLERQHARKWYVSAHSTETEVVRTAYKAVLTSLEHRLGEHFTYQGRAVYNPHTHIESLIDIADVRKLDGREPPGGTSAEVVEAEVPDCPDCKGTGAIKSWIPHTHIHGMSVLVSEKCAMCCGTGKKVSAE